MKAQSSAPASGPAAANEPVVVREDTGNIAVLTLNRPQARNSLSEAMLAALSQELENIAADKRVRAVVIAARGPVFAAVEATATAAGCQLVASCDLAVASMTAKFSTPGVHIGLFCSTPMVALSRNVGRKHAMEMLLTGDMIPAEDAYRVGLVNRVVEPGTAREEALKLARKIATKSAAVVKLGKEAFYRQLEMHLADAYQYATEVMVQNMMARDAEEGIAAFVEKRQPTWKDR